MAKPAVLKMVEIQRVTPHRATVILEGDSYQALDGAHARDEALKAAEASGMSKPGLSGSSGIYPVDGAGRIYDSPGQKIEKLFYRRDFDIMTSPF